MVSKQRPWSLNRLPAVMTAGAAVASLAASDEITAGSAWAQPIPSQPSPTMQRLQQLQKVERDRQSAEDAKWRSFGGQSPAHTANGGETRPVEMAATWYFDALTSSSPPVQPRKCEFYWPGWKLHPDGTRVTKVRGCLRNWVAVDCKSLKVAWSFRGYPPSWSGWALPATSDVETTQMVTELCDNIAPPIGKEAQSLSSIAAMPKRSARPTASVAKPMMPIPNDASFSTVNVGAEGKQILQTLGGMGVVTEIRDRCPKAGVVGAYSRYDNLLVLCNASLRNQALATETIAHEAVHALQDCLQPGGIKGSDSITLTRFLKTFNNGRQSADFRDLVRAGLANRPKTLAYLEELKKSMPRNMYAMEIEAHALDVSPKSVRILLEALAPLCGLPA